LGEEVMPDEGVLVEGILKSLAWSWGVTLPTYFLPIFLSKYLERVRYGKNKYSKSKLNIINIQNPPQSII